MYGKNNDRARWRFDMNRDLELSGRIGENSRAGECAVNVSAATPGPGASKEEAAEVVGRSETSSESISWVGRSV